MYDMNNPFFDEVTGFQLKDLDPNEDMNIVAVPMANYDDELDALGNNRKPKVYYIKLILKKNYTIFYK